MKRYFVMLAIGASLITGCGRGNEAGGGKGTSSEPGGGSAGSAAPPGGADTNENHGSANTNGSSSQP